MMVRSPLINIKPVLLVIVPVFFKANGLIRESSTVLDSGSQATLIAQPIASALGLKRHPMLIRFGSFNSSVEMETNVVSFKLRSTDTAHTCEATDAFVVPKINLSTRKIN